MKKLLLIAFCVCFLSVSMMSQAASTPSCPKIKAIKEAGLNDASKNESGIWTVSQKSNYGDKNHTWTFNISMIQAGSKNGARKQAIRDLQTLRGEPTAQKTNDGAVWMCFYTIDYGHFAVATTPDIKSMLQYSR
jgi:hypothetical protein